MAREVVFIDGMRTAFGRQGGSLKDLFASEYAATVVKALVAKTQVLERGGKVDSVFCGAAAGDAKSYCPARYISLAAGLPQETTASYVEMQCGSAIDAINHAAWKILAGCADVIIAGGMESHSQKVAKFSTTTQPYKGIAPQLIVSVASPNPEECISMIEIADLMAEKWGISRQDCDEFALRSQQRAASAVAKGYFRDEIVPITIKGNRKTPDFVFDKDEHLRSETTLEGLAKLHAVRGDNCVTTAGNASGLNDGAAFVMLMSAEKAKELGYEPYAKWIAGADYGVDPRLMGIGPAYSNMLALKRAGLTISDMDIMECNEAFAAQNLSVIKEMESLSGIRIDPEKWNPNGGAIAFGHPNGASGGRICIFAMKELERCGGRYGFFSSCCGGGQGVTTIIENLRR